jgi:hypothetical protein
MNGLRRSSMLWIVAFALLAAEVAHAYSHLEGALAEGHSHALSHGDGHAHHGSGDQDPSGESDGSSGPTVPVVDHGHSPAVLEPGLVVVGFFVGLPHEQAAAVPPDGPVTPVEVPPQLS